MNEINWKEKLTSRKFWVSVCNFVSMLIIALGGAQDTATKITALIMAGATMIAYVIGEGLRDAAQAKNPLNAISGYVAYEPPEEKAEQPEEKPAEEN